MSSGHDSPDGRLYTSGRRPKENASRPTAGRSGRPPGGATMLTPGRRPRVHRADREARPSSLVDVSGNDTVALYIHGIGNKPVASTLKCQWDQRLFRTRMGQRTRMAYWVDQGRHGDVLDATCGRSDFSEASLTEVEASTVGDGSVPESVATDIPAAERKILETIAAKMEASVAEARDAGFAAESSRAEVLPLPNRWREWVSRRFTRALLPDVHDYLFSPDGRERIDERVRERIGSDQRFVIVAHSLGTVIAYRLLAELQSTAPTVRVPLLVTLGSPLGIKEVQDALCEILQVSKLPALGNVARWLNVADRLDPVAVDSRLQGEFRCAGRVVDVTGFGVNADGPRHPHSATGYLVHEEVRRQVRDAVGPGFAEEVSHFTVARDVAEWVEDAAQGIRNEVLIELHPADDRTLAETCEALRSRIGEWFGTDVYDRCVPLHRFLAVELTAPEIEMLGSFLRDHPWGRIWNDAEKSALTNRSCTTLHAPAAWHSYRSLGQDIHWAVLDTGIRPDHPHFAQESNVEAVWDCTPFSPDPSENIGKTATGPGVDRHGHGTHVAGVIAGRIPGTGWSPAEGEPAGIAPQTKLHSYKVLDDNGRGRDSWIIKAIQHVEEINRRSATLAIHGVNLSLGGDFDHEVYACGHSPLCKELRRLWRQGVVVVIAAGNLGSLTVDSVGRRVRLNLDLSIGDPANLAEAISVGSVHKTDAQLYGVSYFSSRGPTADGRFKPDVVAPGERILSARASFREDTDPSPSDLGTHYVEMSGTSMAAPHVSGLIAAFLSQRRGYLGRPDEVRQILLENATDIGRDRYHQGSGIPNLVRMLLHANS